MDGVCAAGAGGAGDGGPPSRMQLLADAMRGDVTSDARKRALNGAHLPPQKRGRPTNAERLVREVAAAATRAAAATTGRIVVIPSIAADGKELFSFAIASITGHAARAAAAPGSPPPPSPPPPERTASEMAVDVATAAARVPVEEQTVRGEAERAAARAALKREHGLAFSEALDRIVVHEEAKPQGVHKRMVYTTHEKRLALHVLRVRVVPAIRVAMCE